MGQLVFQATAGGQTALVGPNPSTNFSLNVPAVNSTLATLAAQTFTGQQTDTVDASISGLTVGKGGGSASNTTVLGNGAVAATNTGDYLTAVGYASLASNTSGAGSTAFGYYALNANTTGRNTAFGTQALKVNTTGSSNTAVGDYALGANTTASNNTAVGYQAGYSNQTGTQMTAVGFGALYTNTQNNNTAVGYQSGYLNSTGYQNTFTGNQSAYSNTTGAFNCAFGNQALYSNTTASYGTALGYHAGYSNTVSDSNTFIGQNAGYSTTGGGNCFVGGGSPQAAGYYVTTGTKNTILGGYSGNQGGLDIRTSSNYIVLSDGDGNPRQIIDNNGSFILGKTSTGITTNGYVINAAGDMSQVFSAGNYSVINAQTGASTWVSLRNANSEKGSIVINSGSVSYNTTSDYRLKENVTPLTGALNKVAQLKPINYTWKDSGESANGFIAHELQAVAPDCVTGEKDAVDSNGNPKYQSIDTSFLTATLVAAIQELSAQVTTLQAQVTALQGK
jgi:hypothetical protein